MVVSKDEAASALKEIGDTREKVLLMQRYRDAAPHLILWGSIYLFANSGSDLYPAATPTIWNASVVIGVIGSSLLGNRTRKTHAGAQSGDFGLRWAATIVAIAAYFLAVGAVLPRIDASQLNAFISLFFACAYMVAGAWTGWKIFAVGLALGMLILVGYFAVPSHYFLWMGVVTGGTLIGSGLWLRKA